MVGLFHFNKLIRNLQFALLQFFVYIGTDKNVFLARHYVTLLCIRVCHHNKHTFIELIDGDECVLCRKYEDFCNLGSNFATRYMRLVPLAYLS